MRILKLLCIFSMVAFATAAFAQKPEEVKTESSEPTEATDVKRPLDGVVEKKLISERPVLAYDPIREADIFWERRVWRVIDVREKVNLTFTYPENPFFKIINDSAIKGEISAYSTEDDKFTKLLTKDEVATMGASVDTIVTFDPETYEEKRQIVRNEINWENVKQFRVKEVWFFDKESSTLQVRILGMAPLIDEYDDNGNFKYTRPMYWIYYPDCRTLLARNKVFNLSNNDASPITWEDLLEQRFFSSYITKESNVYDRKIEEYATGVDMLLEGEKIKNEIFHFEHDLWSY
jgi:gliding motility associated protien GldN